MAKARMQQQQLYPGVYASSRGARPADHVSSQDIATQAQNLLKLQQVAQLQRQIQLAQQHQSDLLICFFGYHLVGKYSRGR